MADGYKRWHLNPNEWEQLHWKLFFIYMLCVGGVIRLCKVTAQLCNWRIPKPQLADRNW